jgi:putative membrane protein
MTLIASLVLGALIGEIINIEAAMERFGAWLRKVSRSEGDGGFVGGFVNASLTVCVGAMAVVGSIQDGILGDHSTLFAKAVLDLIIVMVMTAASGKGCIFSAIPVAIFQGTITALSKLLEPVMTQHALDNLSLVGSVMIFCVGVNLVWGKKFRVANMLPGLVLAVVCAFLPWF